MTAPSNEVIVERIDNLGVLVKEGFKGVHERQDKTNGNVKDNTKWRLETCPTVKNLQKLVYGTVGFVLIAVGGAFIKLIILV